MKLCFVSLDKEKQKKQNLYVTDKEAKIGMHVVREE